MKRRERKCVSMAERVEINATLYQNVEGLNSYLSVTRRSLVLLLTGVKFASEARRQSYIS